MEVKHAVGASPSSSARPLPRLPRHAGFGAVTLTFLAVSAFSATSSSLYGVCHLTAAGPRQEFGKERRTGHARAIAAIP